EFLSSLTPRTLAWSATAATVAILVPAVVITAVWNEIEQGPPSTQQMAEAPGTPVFAPAPLPSLVSEPPMAAQTQAEPVKLSDEKIAALVGRGRQLMIAGDIRNARLVLQQAAEAGNATAALELGATYDPIELEKWGVRDEALSDIAMARTWYQKAKDLGSTEATERLERLAGRDGQQR